MTYVYIFTNLHNGKKYVGMTQDVYQRWHKHISDAKYGSHLPFHRAIRKYGPQAFSCEIESAHCTDVAAGTREMYLIAKIKPKMGYNVAVGGTGGHTLTREQLDSQYAIKTAHHQEFRRQVGAGATVADLTRLFSAPRSSVVRCLHRLGLIIQSKGRKRKQIGVLVPEVRPDSLRMRDSVLVTIKTDSQSNSMGVRTLVRVKDSVSRQSQEILVTVSDSVTVTSEAQVTITPIHRPDLALLNVARGLSESVQREVLRMYFEEHYTAQQISTLLQVTKGSVRGAVNRYYKRLPPSDHITKKSVHGSSVRTGPRNPNYGRLRSALDSSTLSRSRSCTSFTRAGLWLEIKE